MKYLLLCLSILIMGCPQPVDPSKRPYNPEGKDFCGPACDHIKKLNCQESKGSDPKDPDSCKNDCIYVMENHVDLWPECWTIITACYEIDTKCKR
jgi:hypothetical protein